MCIRKTTLSLLDDDGCTPIKSQTDGADEEPGQHIDYCDDDKCTPIKNQIFRAYGETGPNTDYWHEDSDNDTEEDIYLGLDGCNATAGTRLSINASLFSLLFITLFF
ncbi:MAG: hypothetical protein QNJ97_19200 [Myxococcota bacterium]|nr:hypothetical protein [Myxococcota bacterium]